MKAPKAVMDAWKLQREHGDVKKISDASGISTVAISKALSSGRMAQATFEAIRDFFRNKKVEEKQLVDETLNS